VPILQTHDTDIRDSDTYDAREVVISINIEAGAGDFYEKILGGVSYKNNKQ
jgi:hypothetical protein